MFKKIEIKNFQSHKDTVIEFKDGVTCLTGESDNGKTAIFRAIRWVTENRPSGTDKLNSHWNKDFQERMSVKLYTEKGWVERFRTKTSNGYTICYSGKEPVELSAIGTTVPQEIVDFINLTDVNVQSQLDSPYLISMTPGEASKYLNKIIHLDSIDNILAVAESDKRSVTSEQKIVEKDISDLEKKIEKTAWLDEANNLQKRIDKLDEIISRKNSQIQKLSTLIDNYNMYKNNVVDLTEQKELVKQIEEISVPDISHLQFTINSYNEAKLKVVDLTEQKELVKQIDSIQIPVLDKLLNQITSYSASRRQIEENKSVIEKLKQELPDVCPLCGSIIDKEELYVH